MHLSLSESAELIEALSGEKIGRHTVWYHCTKSKKIKCEKLGNYLYADKDSVIEFSKTYKNWHPALRHPKA